MNPTRSTKPHRAGSCRAGRALVTHGAPAAARSTAQRWWLQQRCHHLAELQRRARPVAVVTWARWSWAALLVELVLEGADERRDRPTRRRSRARRRWPGGSRRRSPRDRHAAVLASARRAESPAPRRWLVDVGHRDAEQPELLDHLVDGTPARSARSTADSVPPQPLVGDQAGEVAVAGDSTISSMVAPSSVRYCSRASRSSPSERPGRRAPPSTQLLDVQLARRPWGHLRRCRSSAGRA